MSGTAPIPEHYHDAMGQRLAALEAALKNIPSKEFVTASIEAHEKDHAALAQRVEKLEARLRVIWIAPIKAIEEAQAALAQRVEECERELAAITRPPFAPPAQEKPQETLQSRPPDQFPPPDAYTIRCGCGATLKSSGRYGDPHIIVVAQHNCGADVPQKPPEDDGSCDDAAYRAMRAEEARKKPPEPTAEEMQETNERLGVKCAGIPGPPEGASEPAAKEEPKVFETSGQRFGKTSEAIFRAINALAATVNDFRVIWDEQDAAAHREIMQAIDRMRELVEGLREEMRKVQPPAEQMREITPLKCCSQPMRHLDTLIDHVNGFTDERWTCDVCKRIRSYRIETIETELAGKPPAGERKS